MDYDYDAFINDSDYFHYHQVEAVVDRKKVNYDSKLAIPVMSKLYLEIMLLRIVLLYFMKIFQVMEKKKKIA